MDLIIANPGRKSKRRRKWGSPKQRAAFRRMRAALRSKSRKSHKARSPRRRRRVHTNPSGGFAVAKRRRRSSRRRSYARRVRTAYRKARRSGRRSVGMLNKYLPPGGVTAIAGGVAGFLGTQYVLGKVPLPAQLATGNGRILAKVLVGIVGRQVLKRVNAPLANAFATGALTSAALDVAAKAMPSGVSGFSGYTPGGGVGYQLLPGDGQDPSLGDADMSGLYAEPQF